jgi:hypothetical protein
MAAAETRSTSESLSRIAVFAVLALVLLVRLAHLSAAMASPLTYQPGPDEDYYRRFALAVALGQGQNSAEFTFMDPAYGYILGAIFRFLGPNLFVVYLLQVLLDTATAYGILTIGRLLGRPRAGLAGALLYGLTSTAVMFCTTLLKEVWVTAFLTWWVVSALTLIRSPRKWTWLLFGFYTGLGVGLRSTLLALAVAAVLLPLLSDQQTVVGKAEAGGGLRNWATARRCWRGGGSTPLVAPQSRRLRQSFPVATQWRHHPAPGLQRPESARRDLDTAVRQLSAPERYLAGL